VEVHAGTRVACNADLQARRRWHTHDAAAREILRRRRARQAPGRLEQRDGETRQISVRVITGVVYAARMVPRTFLLERADDARRREGEEVLRLRRRMDL